MFAYSSWSFLAFHLWVLTLCDGLDPPAFCARACSSLLLMQIACALTAATAIFLLNTLRYLARARLAFSSPSSIQFFVPAAVAAKAMRSTRSC